MLVKNHIRENSAVRRALVTIGRAQKSINRSASVDQKSYCEAETEIERRRKYCTVATASWRWRGDHRPSVWDPWWSCAEGLTAADVVGVVVVDTVAPVVGSAEVAVAATAVAGGVAGAAAAAAGLLAALEEPVGEWLDNGLTD